QDCFCICPTFCCLRLCRCYQARCCHVFNCEDCCSRHCVTTRITSTKGYFYTSWASTSACTVNRVAGVCPRYRCPIAHCFNSTVVYQPGVQCLVCISSTLYG